MEKERISSSSSELKSHPDKSLKKHLLNVGNLSKDILFSKKLNLDKYIDFGILRDISYLIGITHDFGKSTKYFQDYINEKDELIKSKLKNIPETHHGFISSIFTYYIIRGYLSNKNLLEKDFYKYFPIISFFVVKGHHGDLHNADKEIIKIIDFDENRQNILENQINSVDFDEVKRIYNELSIFNIDLESIRAKFKRSYEYKDHRRNLNGFGIKVITKKYLGVVEDFKNEKEIIENINEQHTPFYYFITLFLYSVLLDADKTDAANLKPIKRKEISENLVDNYKKLKFKEEANSKINQMRNDIYEDTISNVENIDLEKDRILSLNVPTGTGKTLTSLSFALKLRKQIENKKGYSPRIIYSLPFLSIIDQNFNVFEDVFDIINKEKPTSDLLLKHHHLSETYYSTKENEFENTDQNIGKDLLLIEGWNSEIVVTTFIQFFYSLISNKNKAIRKFHNIANSIVILDEVQAIPHKYWLLLNRTINFFAKYFNTYFIFLTATQPLIFNENKREIKPLVRNKEKYFRELDRVTLNVNLEPILIEYFKEILKKDLLEYENKDFLIVLNTINSSKDIFNFINSLNIKDSKLYYLSTNIVPKIRLNKIKEIKEKTKKRKIIVSTQLIEAGVDIDVDIIYRDFAPLDSINQIAGRCNRNFGDKKGIVKIFVLKEKDKKPYYQYIYKTFLPSKTEEILKDKYEIKEDKFLELNENYFEKVNIGKSDDDSKDILKCVEELKFDELSNFKLI